jgi:DNA-binding GntR family transcriptional regulator
MRKTHSQDIFKALANAIVAGSIEPGQKLEERALAKQFSVSRTPIREALRQLIGTGLAENRPSGGVTVARIDGHQLGDMFEALGELEGLCARLSAQRMTQIERQKLRLAEESCRQAALAEDAGAFAAQNERLHCLIYLGTHNQSVAQLTQAFRQRMAPFRVPAFHVIAGRARSSVEEHRAIVDAIVDGEGDRACQAMRTHVATTSVSVIDHFDRVRAGLQSAFSIQNGASDATQTRLEVPVQG